MRDPSTGPTLMAHQEEGVAFLLGAGSGLLAFEQGLGKTIVAIEAFRRLHGETPDMRMVVICPNSLKRNWEAELGRFAPMLSIVVIGGSARVRRTEMARTRATVAILSYETARAEIPAVQAILTRWLCILVLDESHAVKNRRSLTSTAAQHFAPFARFRWLLTGTPVTNTVADLYAQIHVVAPNAPLGSFDSFMAAYGGPGKAEALARRIGPYIMRRTKAECLDLPEKIYTDLLIELPPWQRRLYDDMRDTLVCEVEGMTGEQWRVAAPTVLAQLLRLSQIASNPALVAPIGRVPAKMLELDRLIDEIVRAGGEKVILWSHYVRTIQALADRYANLGAVALYGGTPAEDRHAIAQQFQHDPKTRLLVGNPAAAGSGFTLTAAAYSIYETLSWRYDHYAQSQDRNHRIGQTVPVTYVRLVAADTIEEVIIEALARKSALARTLLGDADAQPAIASLTPEQFVQMLMTNRLP